MSKSKVVAHIAKKSGASKAGKFVIPGLGRAVRANRKARMGRNPQTGEPIGVKSHRKASRAFKTLGRVYSF